MAPKRHEPYVGPEPRRGRREEVQDTSVPIPEEEQTEFQEEVGDTPQTSEGTVPQSSRTKRRRRKAKARRLLDTPPTAPFSEEVPSGPTPCTVVPLNQPLVMPTAKMFQTFMMTSIENQALTNQMIQTMMANQSTGQGGKDSGTMTLESRYLRDLQRHKPPSFEGGKLDPIAAENWLEAIETTFHFMNCPPKYEVHCGTYMLKGEAYFW